MIPRLYNKVPYRGRFAPSPTGQLHAGSLMAALGSWIQARKAEGEWLVRIEDIDPPREVSGSKAHILAALEAHGLYWDKDIVYQSDRTEAYLFLISQLRSYFCSCTRQKIKEQRNHIRSLCTPGKALRFQNTSPIYSFDDLFQGLIKIPKDMAEEDFLLMRSDGYFTYQLAVVCDDLAQGITHVIRGEDLLHATGWQLNLMAAISENSPIYGHLPLIRDSRGLKLSKQNHAKPLDYTNSEAVRQNLRTALIGLGHSPPDLSSSELLSWTITT